MKFTAHDIDQRTSEWRQLRAGRLTGSRAKDAIHAIKSGGESAKRRDYRMQLVCERLVGAPQDSDYVNDDMRRGIELEPDARAAYEAHTGQLVRETGFLACDDLMAGCSLDGHLGDWEGVVDFKAPRPANHLEYVRSGLVPAEHVAQLLHAMWITGAAWADFVSYSPAFPADLQLYVKRLPRDEAQIAAYVKQAMAFLDEVQQEFDSIQKLRAMRAA